MALRGENHDDDDFHLHWNNVSQYHTASQTYIDSTGTDLPDFTLTNSSAGAYQTTLSNLGNLFNAYNDGASGFTVTGIPYASYDVYVYVGSNGDGRDATGSIGSEALTFSTATGTSADLAGFTVNSTPDTSFSPYNTLEFTNVTGSSFTYTQSYTGQSVGIFGFEIVNTVPEPST